MHKDERILQGLGAMGVAMAAMVGGTAVMEEAMGMVATDPMVGWEEFMVEHMAMWTLRYFSRQR